MIEELERNLLCSLHELIDNTGLTSLGFSFEYDGKTYCFSLNDVSEASLQHQEGFSPVKPK